jgi:hypothetical protein
MIAVLECDFELTKRADGQILLAFTLRNPGADRVTLTYTEPFVDFTLKATAAGREVEIIRPMYNVGVRGVSTTLEQGQTLRIAPPFRLQFGPPEPQRRDNMVWTLVHEPAELDIEARLHLQDAEVQTCAARLDP